MTTQTIQQIATELFALAKKLQKEQNEAEQRLKEREALFKELKNEFFPQLDTALNKGKEALKKSATKLSHSQAKKLSFTSFRPVSFSKGVFTHFHTKEQQ